MKCLLAPIAGYTDRPFRDLCRSYGADIVYTEMINAHTILYTPEKAMQLLSIEKEKNPVAVQIFGSDPVVMSEAAVILQDWGVSYIDINAGCPAKKVIKNGAGVMLMSKPDLLKRIISSVRKVLTKTNLSVKIRTGIKSSEPLYVIIGKIAEESGADFITLHARSKEEGFSGEPHYQYIGNLKKELGIPVYANGGIFSFTDAEQVISYTNADGVMLARGALARPQIFSEIKMSREIHLSQAQVYTLICRLYLEKTKYYSEHYAVVEMRKMLPYLIKNYAYAKKLRSAVNNCASLSEVFKELSCLNV